MDKNRLKELAGIQLAEKLLNETAKSLQGVLKYFEESGHDGKYTYYDIKEDFVAHWKHENVLVIGIPRKVGVKPTIHTEDRGELEATEDAIANIDVYKLQQVY